MFERLSAISFVLFIFVGACWAEKVSDWWNSKWRYRTSVSRPTPYRDAAPRPVEVAVDFQRLLEGAGVSGEFDPASLRVVQRGLGASADSIPFSFRMEFNAREGREQAYLTWYARPQVGQCGVYDIYFDTKDHRIEPAGFSADLLPPENLLVNPDFEESADGLPMAWKVEPTALARLGRFVHTSGRQSLSIVVDEDTPADLPREVRVSQKIDVRQFAGQEMVFECDLLAERAAYGAPVSIEIQQFRGDGSRIPEFAVQSRWLTIELAQRHLVQFCERGRFNPEAVTAEVVIRLRCYVRDGDSGETVTGPDAYFKIWLDRFVVRPGERWPWPAANNAGFVAGALEKVPLNRAFEFAGQRRLAFNGASEGTLTANVPGEPNSVHWGLQAGTLEFWCRPSWNAEDGVEHVFFDGVAYMHRVQSRLRKLDVSGKNQLEFTIADADAQAHTIRGVAPLRAGQWHHVAATWDFPRAHLQLFVDGRRVAAEGPSPTPWPFSLLPAGDAKLKGMGVAEQDKRSLPMQAFIGGDKSCNPARCAEAAMDEFRISDVVRYEGDFEPLRREFEVDDHARALFHFENERHGLHDADDQFVRGHLFCELPPQSETALLEILADGKIERREVIVKPHASAELFERNRAENRLPVTRPFRSLPDPRFVEYRERVIERITVGTCEPFEIQVEGDYEPWMRAVTFEHAERLGGRVLIPHWRANNRVLPFSIASLNETLAPDARSDEERAFEAFKYSLLTTNYYDGNYCETLPKRHRRSVAYSFIKALNIYPFNQCGPLNFTLRKLFLAVGISSNDASGTHHQFEQAFYRGGWRLFDLSSRVFWLERDNATVLGRPGLEEDPYLKIRQGGDACAWLRGRPGQASFGTAERPHKMDFFLRPGERASLCWHNEGRWFEVTGNREPIPLARIPPYFGNGAIVYTPVAEGDAALLDNLVIEPADVRAKDPARPAALTYRAHSPYIFSDLQVAGQYSAETPDAVCLSLSFDEGKTWTQFWRGAERAAQIVANPRDLVTARYAYWLKLELAAGSQARVSGFRVRTTFVCSPLALPGRLSLGKNIVQFVSAPTVPIKTTCRWVERHRTGLGVALNSISYYLNGDEAHRNVFVAAPDAEFPVDVKVMGTGLSGSLSLDGLPRGWSVKPDRQELTLEGSTNTAAARFLVQARGASAGDIEALTVVVQGGKTVRRVPAQVLVAESALAREAEKADIVEGQVSSKDLPEASGGQVMSFIGDGTLGFDFAVTRASRYALWLRARWEAGSSANFTLTLDESKPRDLRAMAMIGFTDWTNPRGAHTKMFAHYGEQFGHWSWYRVPDVQVPVGKHRLMLGATGGASFDALILLPQTDAIDRAAMNLFQNWNFAPWDNPL